MRIVDDLASDRAREVDLDAALGEAPIWVVTSESQRAVSALEIMNRTFIADLVRRTGARVERWDRACRQALTAPLYGLDEATPARAPRARRSDHDQCETSQARSTRQPGSVERRSKPLAYRSRNGLKPSRSVARLHAANSGKVNVRHRIIDSRRRSTLGGGVVGLFCRSSCRSITLRIAHATCRVRLSASVHTHE